MKKTIIAVCSALLAVGTLGMAPASAAPLQTSGAEFTNAQFSLSFGQNNRDRDGRNGRFERRGSNYYYNGHRGQRERRNGWRQYNGYWFPQSAFSFSITVNPDRGRVSSSARHRDWCEDNYISYRASDNTFKPYSGPRRECVSPYLR